MAQMLMVCGPPTCLYPNSNPGCHEVDLMYTHSILCIYRNKYMYMQIIDGLSICGFFPLFIKILITALRQKRINVKILERVDNFVFTQKG